MCVYDINYSFYIILIRVERVRKREREVIRTVDKWNNVSRVSFFFPKAKINIIDIVYKIIMWTGQWIFMFYTRDKTRWRTTLFTAELFIIGNLHRILFHFIEKSRLIPFSPADLPYRVSRSRIPFARHMSRNDVSNNGDNRTFTRECKNPRFFAQRAYRRDGGPRRREKKKRNNSGNNRLCAYRREIYERVTESSWHAILLGSGIRRTIIPAAAAASVVSFVP